MASNLAVEITANESSLRAQLALAQADVRSFGAQIRSAASTIRSGGDATGELGTKLETLTGQLVGAKAEIAAFNTKLNETAVGGFARLNEGIKAAVEPLTLLSSRMRETAELAGITFAVDKIREWISSMGELGERTVNMAAAVGTTPHEFSLLSRALELAGGDADTAGRTLERLGRNIQEALTTPSSQAAKAAVSLGISQEQLKRASTDLGFALDLVADKFQAFADSPAKSADMMAFMGRGFQQLVPLLRQGSAGMEEFKQKASETGTVLSNEDAEALDQTGEKVHQLAETIEGAGIQAFKMFKPPIDAVTDGLTSLIQKTEQATASIRDMIAEGSKGMIGDLSDPFRSWRQLIKTGKLSMPSTSLPDVNVTAPGANQDFSAGAKPEVAPWPETGHKARSTGGGAAKGQADELATWREQLQQQLEAENNFFTDSTAEELRFWTQKLALTKSGSKEQASVESTIYGLRKRMAEEGLRADEAAEGRQESLDRAYLGAFQRNMQLLVAQKKISLQQALGFDIQYTAQVEAEEKKRLEAFLSDDRLSAAEKASYYDKLLALEASYDSKITEYQTEAATKAATAWTQTVKTISDQFATMATDMITRTKSIAASFDDLMRSLIKDTLQSTFKSLFSSILGGGSDSGSGSGGSGGGLNLMSMLFGSDGVGSALFGKGGLSGMLGLGEGGLLGSLTGSAGGGLLSGLFGGGSSGDQDFSGGTPGLGGSVGGSVASAAGGGLLSTLFGSLFKGVGSLFGIGSLFGFEHGGIVPSAAGGWAVPQLGSGGVLAQLHSQEMVLPANVSNAVLGAANAGTMGGGGNVTHNYSISAVDASSVAKLFMNNGSALVAAVNRASRMGSPVASG
jgi:hypothetical protein